MGTAGSHLAMFNLPTIQVLTMTCRFVGENDRRTLFAELIHACARCQQPEKAFELFAEIQSEYYLSPNRRAYTALIIACSAIGDVQRASDVLTEMDAAGLPPHVQDYNALLTVIAEAQDGDAAFETLKSMAAAGVQPDVRSCKRRPKYDKIIR